MRNFPRREACVQLNSEGRPEMAITPESANEIFRALKSVLKAAIYEARKNPNL